MSKRYAIAAREGSPFGWMRAARSAVAAVVALAAGAFVAAPAQAQFHGRGGACEIFSEPDYRGNSVTFQPGQQEPWYGSRWNDRVSSVRLRRGCRLEVWEHVTFQGIKAVIERDTAYLGQAWDERISSSICACSGPDWRGDDDGRFGRGDDRRRMVGRDARDAPRRLSADGVACVAFSRSNYDGPWRAFVDGDKPQNLGGRLNDRVSSIRVAPGCVAMLDIGSSFKLFVDGDTASFPTGVDNRAGSVDCFCR